MFIWMQVCVNICNWCNWGSSLWDCPQQCDNPKHECGLPPKMFVDTSKPEARSWGEGKPMHVLQSEVLHVSSMSTKEDWLVDIESNSQKWTWGQWIKVQAENFMCIPFKNTLFIELTLGALCCLFAGKAKKPSWHAASPWLSGTTWRQSDWL